jgi:hypothetical protein
MRPPPAACHRRCSLSVAARISIASSAQDLSPRLPAGSPQGPETSRENRQYVARHITHPPEARQQSSPAIDRDGGFEWQHDRRAVGRLDLKEIARAEIMDRLHGANAAIRFSREANEIGVVELVGFRRQPRARRKAGRSSTLRRRDP